MQRAEGFVLERALVYKVLSLSVATLYIWAYAETTGCLRQFTGNLTNECKWYVCSERLLASQFLATACTQYRACTCVGTRKYSRLDSKKILASLWARYNFIASLLSTSLLKLCKSLVPQQVTVLTITFTSTWDSSWKSTENRKLSMPSESFTTSLWSVNSPVFMKKYDKCTNCLCLNLATIVLLVQ